MKSSFAIAPKTRSQKVWLFQVFLDQRGTDVAEERSRLTRLYLTRALSEAIEVEFRVFIVELLSED